MNATLPAKLCRHCDLPFERRPGEKPSRFAERRFCCRECNRLHPRSIRADEWARDDLMAEWAQRRRSGYTRRQVAEQLGVSFVAFDRQYWRARKAGDPRAVDPARGQR